MEIDYQIVFDFVNQPKKQIVFDLSIFCFKQKEKAMRDKESHGQKSKLESHKINHS